MTNPQTEQTSPTTSAEPESGNLFRVLETHAPDPATAHAAVEEVKNMAGHNTVAQLAGRIDKLGAELGARIDSVEKRLAWIWYLLVAFVITSMTGMSAVIAVLLTR